MTKVLSVVLLLLLVALATPALAQTTISNPNTKYFLDRIRDSFSILRRSWKGNDICTWVGVVCDLSRNEVSLVVPNAGLSGVLPGFDVSQFNPRDASISSINLMGNPGIGGTLPSEWSELSSLRTIILNGTGVSGTIPNSWTSLSSMSVVDLSNTNICGDLPSWSYSTMQSLLFLNLENNRNMRGSLSSSFGSFSATPITLQLSGTNFCGCTPGTWISGRLRETVRLALPAVASGVCDLENKCTAESSRCVPSSAMGFAAGGGALSLAAVLLTTALALFA